MPRASHKKRRGNKLPPFVALTWGMLNSEAYKALRFASRAALPYFLGKVKGDYHAASRYETVFHFSYAEAAGYGFASATFSKIVQDVIHNGFIDPEDKGGLRGTGRSYNYFRLSHRWETYGTDSFKAINWKCFVPKPRLKATSKTETYSFKNGNKTDREGKIISENEPVGVF